MEYVNRTMDHSIDQHLMSIRTKGEKIGDVEIVGGKITTYGTIGEGNTYENFVDLIRGLQGHGISIDDFYF